MAGRPRQARTSLLVYSVLKSVLEVRHKFKEIVVDEQQQSVALLHDHNHHILAFARVSSDQKKRVAIVTNMDFRAAQDVAVKIDTARNEVVDLLSKKKFTIKDGHVHASLQPGQGLVFEY